MSGFVTLDSTDRLAFSQALAKKDRDGSSSLVSRPETDADNPLFKAPKVNRVEPSKDEQGGNYGGAVAVGFGIDDEDDDDAEVHREPCGGCLGDRTCTAAGWRLFFRFLRCPCGRPRNPRPVKNPAELKHMHIDLPVSRALRYARPDNVVITSKYTPWDFIPRATALQFRRAVNVFFLFHVFLLSIGYFNPTLYETPFTPFGTLGVLSFVIGVTLVFEGRDDARRKTADAKTNNTPVTVMDPNTGKRSKAVWGALMPGDIVVLHDRELVPADVVALDTANPGGMLYVETSGIDGETNLKIRRAPKEFKALMDKVGAGQPHAALRGRLDCEEPNPFLSFQGRFQPSHAGAPSIGLEFESLLLRGSEVRNTAWVVAVVVYAGHETKLVMSKRNTPSKFAMMDLITNRIIFLTIAENILLALMSFTLLNVWVPNTDSMWYMAYTDSLSSFQLGKVSYFLTFMIIFANVVPISLYVIVEFTNFWAASMLEWDLEMYDPVTDMPARCKSTNLVSEIGQVSHIFSDKTGTLTQNVMRLVGVSAVGKRFGVKVPDATNNPAASGGVVDSEETALGKRNINQREVFADLLREVEKENAMVWAFLTILAVCHTVVMDTDDAGNPRYNAEGPDEEALVKAAAALGFVLVATDNSTYKVKDPRGKVREFAVLATFGFTSDRKRMSLLVKTDGEAWIYLKGADSVVMELARGGVAPHLQTDLDAFAQSGLRTLLVARKRLSQAEADDYVRQYNQAKTVVGAARVQALEALGARAESGLEVVGATAIEDALQEGVPETIEMIRKAGIAMWVLTGDKVDTAINIGFSSKLLDPDMHQILIDGGDQVELLKRIGAVQSALSSVAYEVDPTSTGNAAMEIWDTSKSLALVMTGKAIEQLLAKQKGSAETERALITLASQCSVVLACRVSPAQKALLVRAASKGARARGGRPPVTLAIGDGANDVAMIQEARVGVGISGKEGLQAVNSADFAIAQFRFLQRTLFVHGRWSYRRSAAVLMYVCYSWHVLNWAIVWYLFLSAFSGQQIYQVTYYVTVFSWIFNSWIVIIISSNRDVSNKTVMAHPRAYDVGRYNLDLTHTNVLVGMMLRALVHGTLLFLVVTYTRPVDDDLEVFGNMAYLGLAAVLFTRQIQLIQDYTRLTVFLGFVDLAFFYLCVCSVDAVVYGTFQQPYLLSHTAPWGYVCAFLLAGIIVALEHATSGARKLFFPRPTDVLREIDHGYGEGLADVHDKELDVFADGEGPVKSVKLPKEKVERALGHINSSNGGAKGALEKFGSKRGFAYAAPDEPPI